MFQLLSALGQLFPGAAVLSLARHLISRVADQKPSGLDVSCLVDEGLAAGLFLFCSGSTFLPHGQPLFDLVPRRIDFSLGVRSLMLKRLDPRPVLVAVTQGSLKGDQLLCPRFNV